MTNRERAILQHGYISILTLVFVHVSKWTQKYEEGHSRRVKLRLLYSQEHKKRARLVLVANNERRGDRKGRGCEHFRCCCS